MTDKERKEKENELKQLYKDRESVGAYGWAFAYDERIKELESELNDNN